MNNNIKNPGTDFSGSGPVEYGPAEVAPEGALGNLLATEEARLLAVPGVTSVGIGLGPAGGEALVVGVVDAGVAARLPLEIKGVPVVVTITGEVDALPRR
jgi:hypothetical protein